MGNKPFTGFTRISIMGKKSLTKKYIKMDEFSYTNIFDTKGIEYLIVIGFLILIIPFWRALNKPVKVKARYKEVLGVLTPEVLRIPQGLHYCKNHLWTHLKKSGNAHVGLNDLFLHITGEIELINFRNPGERVRKGDLIAKVSQGGKELRIPSPISGEITDVNFQLRKTPNILNEDPYGKGCIYIIKPHDWNNDTHNCVTSEKAREWSENELQRFKDFVAIALKKHSPESTMLVLQEGGELIKYPLAGMPAEVWKEFQECFLSH